MSAGNQKLSFPVFIWPFLGDEKHIMVFLKADTIRFGLIYLRTCHISKQELVAIIDEQVNS